MIEVEFSARLGCGHPLAGFDPSPEERAAMGCGEPSARGPPAGSPLVLRKVRGGGEPIKETRLVSAT